jgi:hypothetical protein
MSDNREDELKSHIRRLTKRIGEAKLAFDFNEVENLRNQRGSFVCALIEEFQQGFAIIDGKTVFMSTEELDEHYENEDVQKQVYAAAATTEILQVRDSIIKRMKRIEDGSAEDLKVEILASMVKEIAKLEAMGNDISVKCGSKEIDFKAIDESRQADNDLMDGFDMSSLK